MAVFVVLVGGDFKGGGLYSASGVDNGRFRFLLREHCAHAQLAKLQVGFDSEKCSSSVDEGVFGSYAYVSGFDVFDDFVFMALIGQSDAFGVEIESGVGVVIESEIDFVAYFGVYVELYLAVEVKGVSPAGACGKHGVVDVGLLKPCGEFYRPLCGYLYSARSENIFQDVAVSANIEQRKGFFLGGFLLFVPEGVPLFEIDAVELLGGVVHILCGSHCEGGAYGFSADFVLKNVTVGFGVVVYFGLDVGGCLQVEGVLLQEVFRCFYGCFPNGKTCVEAVGLSKKRGCSAQKQQNKYEMEGMELVFTQFPGEKKSITSSSKPL